MTTLNCYCIYDNQVDAFTDAPFYARTHGEAIRGFGDIVNKPGNPISQHPSDYVLFFICTFDPENGNVHQPDGGASRLVTGLDVKERTNA